MNNKVFFLIVCMSAACPTFGQSRWQVERDSLLKVLSLTKVDSTRVWVYMQIGELYLDNHPDSSLYYARTAERLSTSTGFAAGIANAMSMQAAILSDQNKVDSAIGLDLAAIEIARRAHEVKALANLYNNTAIVYNNKGDHSASLDNYLRAEAIYEQLKDSASLAFAYGNIASVYNDLKEYHEAYAYSLKGVLLCRQRRQEKGYGPGMINLSTSLINLTRYDTALVVLYEVRDFAARMNDVGEQIDAMANIDYAYVGTGKFDQIKANAERMMALALSTDSKEGRCYALFGLTEYYVHGRRFSKARDCVNSAIAIAERYNMVEVLRDAYKEAAQAALVSGDLTGSQRFGNLRDSIDNELLSDKILKNTQELEAKYALNQKQGEIDDLTKEKRIEQLTLRQQRIVNWALAMSVLVAGFVVFLYSRNYRQKRKLLMADSLLQRQRIVELEQERQLLAARAVMRGQVEERSRLAKDLHDGLGSILSSAKYSFSDMKDNLSITAANAEAFERSMVMLDRSISELRRVAHNMMPEALTEFGLDTALRDFCNSLNHTGGLTVTYQSFEIDEDSISKITGAAIYRIIQELMNNILKHAEAVAALVQLIRKGDALSVTVEDNGKGFDTSILHDSQGIGYLSLKSRVDYLNGTMDIEAAPGKGTSVNIEIPNVRL